jgi:ribose-phosphate pyrophosphokinase
MELLNNSADGDDVVIYTRVNNSDALILLALVADTIARTWNNEIHVYMPYAPYQQADRAFSDGESFSVKTIANILNALPVTSYTVFDAHSDVFPALVRNCHVESNHQFVTSILILLTLKYKQEQSELVILSPDAGAYKKIFKLAEAIGFKGSVETANKYRDTTNGELQVRLSLDDFGGRNILIIDDICIGGRTFTALADELRKRNVGQLFLAVSHGIFSNGLLELGKEFSDIFTTNSRADDYEKMVQEVQEAQIALNAPRLFQLHVSEQMPVNELLSKS